MNHRFSLLLVGALCYCSGRAQDTLRIQVHGMVANADTGAPVGEAMVEWFDDKDHRQAVTQTNSDGHYALFVRTTGMLILRVEEAGYTLLRDTLNGFVPGESAREHDLLLDPLEQ